MGLTMPLRGKAGAKAYTCKGVTSHFLVGIESPTDSKMQTKIYLKNGIDIECWKALVKENGYVIAQYSNPQKDNRHFPEERVSEIEGLVNYE